jgi:hypothetical protein
MIMRRLLAGLSALAAAGALAVLAPGMASAQSQPPPVGSGDNDAPLYFFDNTGQGYALTDNGHNEQATITREGTGFRVENEETISGTVYFQLEDTNGFCLNDGISGKVYLESCPVDSANELISMTGTDNLQLRFKQTGDYITTSSVASGQDVIQSSSAVKTEENSWQYQNEYPVERVLGVDFNGPTSTDWTSYFSQHDVWGMVFEVCQTVDGVSECGGTNTQADTAWDSTLTDARSAGVTMFYYISTDDGAVPLSTLETDASNAESWYGTYDIGFMFDEVQSAATDACSGAANCQAYYQELADYIDGTEAGDQDYNAQIMLNPGTPPTANYFADQTSVDPYETIQLFENGESAITSFAMPSWAASYCTCQFAATVEGGPGDDYTADISYFENAGVGDVFDSDESAPADYNDVPSFLAAESAYEASYDPGDLNGTVGVP